MKISFLLLLYVFADRELKYFKVYIINLTQDDASISWFALYSIVPAFDEFCSLFQINCNFECYLMIGNHSKVSIEFGYQLKEDNQYTA